LDRAIREYQGSSALIFRLPDGCTIDPLGDERPGAHVSVFVVSNFGGCIDDRLVWDFVWEIQGEADRASAFTDQGCQLFI